MDVRQLQALVAVADSGTFSAAAARLHTVQSNVSAHVARLERELGATLVDRAGGRLTDEGEAVVARSRRVFYELDALRADIAALRDEVRGTARLGMIGTAGRWLVPALLDEISERHPGIHLVVVEGQSTSLEPRLASGELDVSLLNLSRLSPDLSSEPLFDEDLVLVLNNDDPWADRPSVTIADVAERELLLPLGGTAYRDEVEAAARDAGVTLRVKAELDGLRLIASLTFAGTAAAILPASAVPTFMRDSWRSIPVDGLPRRRVVMAVRRRGLPSAPARAVIQAVRTLVVGFGAVDAGIHPTVGSVAH